MSNFLNYTMKKITFLTFALALFCQVQISAQHEVSFKIGHEMPMGELRWVYNSAPSLSAGYSFLREGNKTNQSMGIGIGLFQFKPKEEIFYYLLDEEEYGTISYSNYKFFQLFIPFRIDYLIGDKLEIFGGVDLGYYYVSYRYENKNNFVSENSTNIEGKGAIAPKCGVNYNLSDKIGFTLQAKYNAYFSLGSSDQRSASFNSNLGTGNHFFSTQIGTYIRF